MISVALLHCSAGQLVPGPGAPVGLHTDVPALDGLDRPDASAAVFIEEVHELTWPRRAQAAEEAAREPGATFVVQQLEIRSQDELSFDAGDGRTFAGLRRGGQPPYFGLAPGRRSPNVPPGYTFLGLVRNPWGA
jgi:hypothetical protein